jgi:hypothetical protein
MAKQLGRSFPYQSSPVILASHAGARKLSSGFGDLIQWPSKPIEKDRGSEYLSGHMPGTKNN